MTLPVVQTYSDGTVVKWDQPTPASGKEPENPAPTLELVAAADTPPPPSAADPGTPVAETSATGGGEASDGLARWLGGAGLALGAAALAVGLVSNRRRTA